MSTGQFDSTGYGSRELARMVADGKLVRVRRGAYASPGSTELVAAHRRLLGATLPRLAPDAAISHASAAVMHDLPVWKDDLTRVHVVRPRRYGGRRGEVVHVHPADLPEEDVEVVDGYRVTGLARTTADCARTLSYTRSVAVGDAALRRGMDRGQLIAVLRRPGSRHGDPQARRVADFIQPRAESVGESISRVTLAHLGIPPAQLQYPIADPDTGEVFARADFAWPEHRTVGEFDGKIKYGRLVPDGQKPGDVVWREKQREDRLRRLGWEVVRWTWADLRQRPQLRDRILMTFELGDRRLG